MKMKGNPAELVHPFTEEEKLEIRGQVERLIQSSYFRHSKRYPNFIRHVVEVTLAGHSESLKERTLGIEIFDREPSYDTAGDSIVRVAAAEVRKRIAQYYQEYAHESEMRIELPSGSYLPHFRNVILLAEVARPAPQEVSPEAYDLNRQDAPEPIAVPAPEVLELQPAVPSRLRLWIIGPSLVVLALLLGSGLLFLNANAPPTERRLLEPFLQSSANRVFLCVGSPSVRENQPAPAEGGVPRELGLPTENNALIPFSDSRVLAMVSGMLDKSGRAYKIQLSRFTNFSDLRAGPVVLIGALDNEWTRRLDGELPFLFLGSDGGKGQVVERGHPDRILGEVDFSVPYSERTQDYAVVSITQSDTLGEPVLLLAGIGPNGTASAGEFFQSAERFQDALKAAPKSWHGRNMAVLLVTKVIQGHSGPPQIVATRFW